MKLAENDLEQSYFQSIPKGNDKFVSYVFACFVLLLFFSLFLFGMYRAQSVADPNYAEHHRHLREAIPEIGNFDESTKK